MTPEGALTPLRVITFPGGANLPLWVAEDEGFFARERLTVATTPTPNSVFLVESMMRGEQDIALCAFDNVVAYQEGQGEVALAQAPDLFAFMGVARGTVRLVVNPEIRSYGDLKGRTLGVDAVATGYALALRKLLQIGGLGAEDYKLESIGGTAMRAKALLENRTPGTILTTPLELAPEARGYRRLANVTDAIGPYQAICGVARRSWAGAHRETLIAFIRALAGAIDWLFDAGHRDAAIASYRKRLPDVPEHSAARAIEALTAPREGFAPRGAVDHDGARTVLAIRSEFGRPPKKLDDPLRYIDESYWRAALAVH